MDNNYFNGGLNFPEVDPLTGQLRYSADAFGSASYADPLQPMNYSAGYSGSTSYTQGTASAYGTQNSSYQQPAAPSYGSQGG